MRFTEEVVKEVLQKGFKIIALYPYFDVFSTYTNFNKDLYDCLA